MKIIFEKPNEMANEMAIITEVRIIENLESHYSLQLSFTSIRF